METETHEVKSGASNEMASIPIKFSVYSGSGLDKSEVESVRDRWIYVFKKKSWGTKISAEIHVDDSGNLNLVNWKGETWPDTDDRPADVSRDEFEVSFGSDEDDVFFFVSRVQLARERIRSYVGKSGLETVPKRGQLFDPEGSDHVEPLGDDQPGCRVYLIDHLHVAEERHKQYKGAANRCGKFLDDEKASTRQMLATLTHNVAESIAEEEPEVWTWISRTELQDEINSYKGRREELEDEVDEKGQQLCDWMQLPAYEEMLSDYTGTEALEDKGHDLQAKLCAGLSQSEAGRGYLQTVLEDKDSWHNKVAVPSGKYLFGQSRRAVGATENALDLMQEFGAAMAASNVNKAGSLMKSFFKVRFDARVSFYETVRKAGGGMERNVISFKQFSEGGAVTKGIDVDETTRKLKGAKVNVQRLGAVLNLINLGMVGKCVAEAEGTEKQMLAMVDLTWAISDVVGSITDFVEAGKSQLVGRTATIIGGVLGYGKSVYEIATRSPEQNSGVIAGMSLAALGGAFTAASGVSAMTGSLLFGMGSTGIGLIGAGLALIGAGVVHYFKETDLEKWFKQCPWATDQPSTRRPARAHLNELFETLAGFAVQCDVLRVQKAQVEAVGSDSFFEWKTDEFEYVLRFRIFPGLYYPKRSVFEVKKLTIGGHDIGAFSIGLNRVQQARQQGQFTFEDESVLEVKEASGQVEEITRLWGLEGYPTGTPEYEYTVTLDVLGNGKYTVEVEQSGSTMPVHDVDGNTVETLK